MAKRKTGDLVHITDELWPLARPIDEAKLDPDNENEHDEASIAGIAASLRAFGQLTPIVVNAKTRRIAKGNGTWQAAKQIGWTSLAMVFVEQDKRSHAGYRLADNRTAQLAHWNEERLALAIADLQKQDGALFEALALEALAADLPAAAGEEDGDGPPAVEVPQIYALLITCDSEAHQKKLFKQLKKDGLKVKAQVL